MLGVDELLEIEEIVRVNLGERLEEILTRLNRLGKLDEFLLMIGMSDLLGERESEAARREGKIIVIGQSEVGQDKLAAVAKNLGISKDRFEFYLDYNDAKSFNFKKTQWSDAYSVILVGQMPHSGIAKGDFGSIISAIESQEGYPPVIRIGMNGLKITKAAFKNALEDLIRKGIIA